MQVSDVSGRPIAQLISLEWILIGEIGCEWRAGRVTYRGGL